MKLPAKRAIPALAQGVIDCDIHPAVPGLHVLLPYMDDYWREEMVARGINELNLELTSYPLAAPLCARPDWRPANTVPGADFEMLRRQALDHFDTRFAICNCLHAAQVVHNEYMAAALCRAVNDWVAREWLDRDTRLRASIVVSVENPDTAAEEIERCAADRRFVQVLLLVMGEMPLGRRCFWPIYRAAERHELAVGIHAGSSFRHAPTSSGWPSYFLEDYVVNSQAFASQLLSLISEGVFNQFPGLKVVLIESGVTWLPGFIWRANKTWRGVRSEVPWLKQSPGDIIREHVRMTIQPLDMPPQAAQLETVMEQIGSDRMLLFSTDYPHWHFDGDDVLPDALSGRLISRIAFDNALETYPRLNGGVEVRAGAAAP